MASGGMIVPVLRWWLRADPPEGRLVGWWSRDETGAPSYGRRGLRARRPQQWLAGTPPVMNTLPRYRREQSQAGTRRLLTIAPPSRLGEAQLGTAPVLCGSQRQG